MDTHFSGLSSGYAVRRPRSIYFKLRKLLESMGADYILSHRGPDTDLRRWGLAHAVGGKAAKKRAVVGVARRLAVLLHRLWVTGEVYLPLRREEVAT